MFKKVFTNNCKIKIEGLNIDRLFTILKRKNIQIKEINRASHKELFFEVDSGQVKKLFTSLKDSCYNVSVKKHYGLAFILNFFKKKLGVLIGLIALVVLISFLNSFIWSIEVYGLDKLSKNEVINTLNEAGIEVGSVYKGSSVEEVESYLRQKLNLVSMVSIVKKGSSVLVNIKEVRVPKIMELVNETSDLVASYDGVITGINSLQGTCLVTVGDTVKKGDVLIAGHFYTIDGVKTKCLAMGEVFAKVWYTETVTFQTQKTEMLKTGKSYESSWLKLFGKEFVVNDFDPLLQNLIVEEKEEYLFKNNLIPLKIKKKVFYETTPTLIKKDYDQNKQRLFNEALMLAKEKVPITQIVQNQFTTVEKNGNTYSISAFLECEIRIDQLAK